MERITIYLDTRVKDALLDLSQRELRDPRMEAGLIIRNFLEQYGLLELENNKIIQVDDKIAREIPCSDDILKV